MQRLLSPPAGYNCVESTLHRCFAPLSSKHLLFLETFPVTAVINLSNSPLSVEFPAGVTVHELPFDAVTLHLQTVLEALELVLSLSTHTVLLVGSPKSSFDALIIACIRRIQGWTLLSTVTELRFHCTARSFDMEQFIENFEPSLLSLESIETLPRYLQMYRDAKVAYGYAPQVFD